MIISTKQMLLNAKRSRYAVPAFNIHNLETMQVVFETCFEMRSPVIIAMSTSTIEYAGGDYIVGISEVASNKYDIPVAVHLDHFKDTAEIKKYIKWGFKSCMIDASHHGFGENVAITREIADYAHLFGASVEAEIGVIGGTEDNVSVDERDAMFTNPKDAVRFVEQTDIDSLAVAIGTAHGLYKGEPKLDFGRLSEIASLVDVPLVLHGASDVPDEMIKKAISLGICKVNIATDLKIPFGTAVRDFFLQNPSETDPRKYMAPGKAAMKEVVKHKIEVCGSFGKV